MGIKKNQLGTAIGAGASPVVLAEQSAPAAEADTVKLYAKDVSGESEMFVRDSAGNEVQVTDDGVVSGSNRTDFPFPVNCATAEGLFANGTGSCSYYFTVACAANAIHFCATPADGDRVGLMIRSGATSVDVVGCGGHLIWALGCSTAGASHTVSDISTPYVWRYNAISGEWDIIQG